MAGLSALFVWQAYSSVAKFLSGNTTNAYKTLSIRMRDFPGVSLCSYYWAWERSPEEEVPTFKQQMEALGSPKFFKYIRHKGGVNGT